MIGMLYKIVPFLVWLHLQNLWRRASDGTEHEQGDRRRQIDRQMRAHFVWRWRCCWRQSPGREWFTYPAGMALWSPMPGCCVTCWPPLRSTGSTD
jgi:hypothetical protein